MKLLATTAALLALVLVSTAARAQVPQLISYQGVLTDAAGNLVPDGPKDITFRFFSSAVGGAILHDETHLGVPVSKGGFSVLIGSVAGDPLLLPFTVPYWLEIQVAPDALPLTPRIQLASSPYTQTAETVLDNAITTAKIATGGVQGVDILDNTITAVDIAPDAVGASEIATGGVTTAEILDNTVGSGDVQNNSLQDIDILDEPGVGFNQTTTDYLLPADGTDLNTVSVTITTPAPGHILVTMGGFFLLPGHTAGNITTMRASISELSGVMDFGPQLQLYKLPSNAASGDYYIPFGRTMIFTKPAAGVYTFYLVGDLFAAGDVCELGNPTLQAVFYPTLYGTAIGSGAPAGKVARAGAQGQ